MEAINIDTKRKGTKEHVNRKQSINVKINTIILPYRDKPELEGKSAGCKKATASSNGFGGRYKLESLKEIKYYRRVYSYGASSKYFGIRTIEKDFKHTQLIGKIHTIGKNKFRVIRKTI